MYTMVSWKGGGTEEEVMVELTVQTLTLTG